MQTVGWVLPGPQERLVHTLHRQMLIALGVDQKILPASVINQVTKDKAAEVAAEQGYPVGRRQMREMKERVADDLRARAFSRRSMTRAWIDPDNGLLVVDAAAPARAEELVATLRDTITGFSAHLLETEKSPSVSMGAWLMFGMRRPFHIENDLELQAVDDTKLMVRYVRHPLEGRKSEAHLQRQDPHQTGHELERSRVVHSDRGHADQAPAVPGSGEGSRRRSGRSGG
jgi:recombination associated protein RdgC